MVEFMMQAYPYSEQPQQRESDYFHITSRKTVEMYWCDLGWNLN